MPAQRPNILLVMADQLTPFAIGAYGHQLVKTPNIDALAGHGVVFDAAYCNSPLCAPARFALVSGQRISRIGAYDNAAYLASTVPTFAHYLRSLGYQTSLAGKMHFVGPDQLHGFEERLTTDIYPADFGWTPDWHHPEQRIDWWYHNMLSVKQAGVAEITNQLEFDDETGYQATQKLYQLARNKDRRPFLLTVSFTHPHDPYATRQRYWDLYDHTAIDLPRVAAIPYDQQDPHSQRLYQATDMGRYPITDNDIRNARHAYYGNVSYIDQWLGRLQTTLADTRLADDTVVIFTSDHGDMLGERGLWYKMSFFESASRVPLIVAAPARFQSARIKQPVSHVDLLPTLVDLARQDQPAPDWIDPLDGCSLLPLVEGATNAGPDAVLAEYCGEAAIGPILMIRRERYKYVFCAGDPPQLFDVESDPGELTNLAADPAHAELAARFHTEVLEHWDPTALKHAVIADQDRRRWLDQTLRQGRFTPWDYQPPHDDTQRYMRNHLDLNELESHSRFPRSRSESEFD